MKEIDGKMMKCCCSSNAIGDAKKSTFVACKLKEGTVGCKGLVGPFYHSYNNMGSKYSKLQNFGKCMVPVGAAESSGSFLQMAARINHKEASVNITAAVCNELVQGPTLREGRIAGCKCVR